ncbi:hypothetical protein [Carboxylicivirga sp. N1Y90]|uniref:hypothetical protein n=1 Tax=Carboxylicivirga fragile TaxID=3417571 RepID=UPI003D33AD3C|nr:hypothetical protein [Marinilabiliaceae bacterium N1Y90]
MKNNSKTAIVDLRSTSSTSEASNFMEALTSSMLKTRKFDSNSLIALASFMNDNEDLAGYISGLDEDESMIVNKSFRTVSNSLNFNCHLHRLVMIELKGVFTSQQLAYIFQAYNGTSIQYNQGWFSNSKDNLLDSIEYGDGVMCYLGDLSEFRTKIASIDHFKFEVFVNLIYESWRSNNISFNEVLSAIASD